LIPKFRKFSALFGRHFERFRTAKVSAEPIATQILEMSEMPDPINSRSGVFGYRPFDSHLAGRPKPRRGLPGESGKSF